MNVKKTQKWEGDVEQWLIDLSKGDRKWIIELISSIEKKNKRKTK